MTQGLIDEKVQEEEESRAKLAVSAASREQRGRQHKGDAAKQGADRKTGGRSPTCEWGQCTLTRFAIEAKGPDGKWTRKPLTYRESNNVHLRVTCPPKICVNLVFKHIHAASSYIICRQFVPLIYCPL